jgi:PKD repeat protein
MKVAVAATGLDATATVTFDPAIWPGEQPQPWKVDWGDGTVATVASGTTSASHTYAKAGFFKITVRGNDASATQTVRVGVPAYPALDAQKMRESREGPQEDLAAVLGTTGVVG